MSQRLSRVFSVITVLSACLELLNCLIFVLLHQHAYACTQIPVQSHAAIKTLEDNRDALCSVFRIFLIPEEYTRYIRRAKFSQRLFQASQRTIRTVTRFHCNVLGILYYCFVISDPKIDCDLSVRRWKNASARNPINLCFIIFPAENLDFRISF